MCHYRYLGTRCESDVDECSLELNLCQNNATCMNSIGSYSCSCTEGFSGLSCSEDINECDTSPCITGTCMNTQGSFSCLCNSSFTGVLCETLIDPCQSNSCSVNGVCVIVSSTEYSCTCLTGYTGELCEQGMLLVCNTLCYDIYYHCNSIDIPVLFSADSFSIIQLTLPVITSLCGSVVFRTRDLHAPLLTASYLGQDLVLSVYFSIQDGVLFMGVLNNSLSKLKLQTQ